VSKVSEHGDGHTQTISSSKSRARALIEGRRGWKAMETVTLTIINIRSLKLHETDRNKVRLSTPFFYTHSSLSRPIELVNEERKILWWIYLRTMVKATQKGKKKTEGRRS
jgi:hypothetical protein